jgi:hypothetical protein
MVMMLIPAPMTTIIVIVIVVFRQSRSDGQCEDNRRRREGGNKGLTHPNLHKVPIAKVSRAEGITLIWRHEFLHRHPVIKHLENNRDDLPEARQ